MNIKIAIGLRVKQIRKAQSLNQPAFADTIGLSQGFLSRVEAGKENLSRPVILLLCYLYRINENWLLTGENPMHVAGYHPPEGVIQLSQSSPLYQLYRQLERIYNEGDRRNMEALRAQLRAFDPGEKKQSRGHREDGGVGSQAAG